MLVKDRLGDKATGGRIRGLTALQLALANSVHRAGDARRDRAFFRGFVVGALVAGVVAVAVAVAVPCQPCEVEAGERPAMRYAY